MPPLMAISPSGDVSEMTVQRSAPKPCQTTNQLQHWHEGPPIVVIAIYRPRLPEPQKDIQVCAAVVTSIFT